MAKGKTKTGKAGKVPKQIAGVKVPKSVRSSGAKLMDALSHPLIADVAAAALIAAATALRDGDRAGKATRKAAGAAGKASSIGSKLAAKALQEAERIGTIALAEAVGGKGKKGGRSKKKK